MLIVLISDFRRIRNKTPMPIRHFPFVGIAPDSRRFTDIELSFRKNAYLLLNVLIQLLAANGSFRPFAGHCIFYLVLVVKSKTHGSQNQVHYLKRKVLLGINFGNAVLYYLNTSAFKLTVVFKAIEKTQENFSLLIGYRHFVYKQPKTVISIFWCFREAKGMFYELIIKFSILIPFIFGRKTNGFMPVMAKENSDFSLVLGEKVKQFIYYPHIRVKSKGIYLLPLYFLPINRSMRQRFLNPEVKFIQEFVVQYYSSVEIGIIWAILVAFVEIYQTHFIKEKAPRAYTSELRST